MRALLERPVFRVRDETYSWADVATAAALWGDWERVRQSARAGLACLLAYRESQRPMPEAAIDEAATEFRYAHELISAEDAKAWFARWGITPGEWMDFIRRSVLRQQLARRLDELMARYPVDEAELRSASGVEAICSGLFQQLAPKVAARAATYDRIRDRRENGGPVFSDEAVGAVLRTVPRPDFGLTAQEAMESARRIARLELAMQELRGELLSPRALAEQVAAHHLDWIRVEYQTLEYPAEAMAREALLCAREDGMSFEALASDTAVAELRVHTAWIGDITGALHGALLGARPGDVVGPFPAGRAYALHRLIHKTLPTPDDELVRQRAERSLVSRALAAELQERVHWLVPPA